MLVSAPVKRARIIVLHSQAAAVTRALGQLGAMQLTRSDRETGQQVDVAQMEEDIQRWQELSSRAENVMERLGIELPEELPTSDVLDLPLREAEGTVKRIEGAAREPLSEIEDVSRELQENRERMQALAPFRGLTVPIERITQTDFLHATTGTLPAWEMRGLRRELPDDALLVPLERGDGSEDGEGLRAVVIMLPRKKRFALRTTLDKFDFVARDFPADVEGAPAQQYDAAQEKREKLQQRRAAAEERISELAHTYRDTLIRIYQRARLELNVRDTERTFGTTRNTVAISGWVPSEKVPEVRETVKRVTGGQAVVEVRDATREEIEEGEVPSYNPHWSVLQPFARLVSGYGSASYREIEPTLLFAISFLLMFGLMFGDLGHGLCLVLAGLGVRAWGRRQVVRDLGYVVAAAGASSALFGAFFQGTMFGWSLTELGFQWTLGFEPVRLHGAGSGAESHVKRYLIISILLGVLLLSLGMILNIVNRLRMRDYTGACLQQFGLVGLVFYWSALGVTAYAALSEPASTSAWLLSVAVAVPLLLLFLAAPLKHLLDQGTEGVGDSAFTGVVHGLESVMTLFANTLSFMRVAAFALSHAGLSFTVLVFMRVVGNLPVGPFFEALVFVLGTALVIGLEGLIVAIQIFRLEYYEFFTKFFRAEGRQFQPFQLVRSG